MRRKSKLCSIALAVLILGGCAGKNSDVVLESANIPTVAQTPEPTPEPTPVVLVAGYDELLAGDAVLQINLSLNPDDWSEMTNARADEVRYAASLEIGGITVDNVGVRVDGGASADNTGFMIEMDYYEAGQSLAGLDALRLDAMDADSTMLRRMLAREAYTSLGADVPYLTYCVLSVNGEPQGLYLAEEALKESFMERVFGISSTMYKANENSRLIVDGTGAYTSIELVAGYENRDALVEFAEALNAMPDGEKGDIENYLNVRSALMYIAANVALGNYESYNGPKAYNYALYEDMGIFAVLPYDDSAAFGGGTSGAGAESVRIDAPVMGVELADAPLIGKLLAVEEYRAIYDNYLEQLAGYLDGIGARIDALQARIAPYADTDNALMGTGGVAAPLSNSTPPSRDGGNPPVNSASGGAPGGNPPENSPAPGASPVDQSPAAILMFAQAQAINLRAQLSGEEPPEPSEAPKEKEAPADGEKKSGSKGGTPPANAPDDVPIIQPGTDGTPPDGAPPNGDPENIPVDTAAQVTEEESTTVTTDGGLVGGWTADDSGGGEAVGG